MGRSFALDHGRHVRGRLMLGAADVVMVARRPSAGAPHLVHALVLPWRDERDERELVHAIHAGTFSFSMIW